MGQHRPISSLCHGVIGALTAPDRSSDQPSSGHSETGVSLQVGSHWNAPLPHPNDFEHYERVHPGSADRILRMAETEQQARIHANEARERR
ncbi:MAG: DUF2335 domain-containing protein [Acidimicrobiia bacterium]|nr:DUF2335 domain-containing protein [Acidimicrobiia bacterium]MYD41506.1 DUF2335 domain-containing protein [Acidimicrobiia bacterium]MYG91842.1 DUF2335 domain-containing protein [Acidimicrobiia bacterium]